MAAIKDSIARLFAWKLGLHGVNPGATVKLVSAGYIKKTRYPKGSTASISAVSSHQTVNYTACPGKYLQAQLPSIRAMGAAYSDVVISAPSPAAQTITSGATPFTFTSAANRAVTWTADVLSPCSDTPVRTYTGTTAGPGPISVTWDLLDTAGAPALPATYTIRMTGVAADGTPVATVTSDLTIAPAPGGAWGPCANASRVAGAIRGGHVGALGPDLRTGQRGGRPDRPGGRRDRVTGCGRGRCAAGPLPGGSAAAHAGAGRWPLRWRPTSRLDGGEVFIVGGPGVVSDATAAAVAPSACPSRGLAGATDAATAAAVAARMPAPPAQPCSSPRRAPPPTPWPGPRWPLPAGFRS